MGIQEAGLSYFFAEAEGREEALPRGQVHADPGEHVPGSRGHVPPPRRAGTLHWVRLAGIDRGSDYG